MIGSMRDAVLLAAEKCRNRSICHVRCDALRQAQLTLRDTQRPCLAAMTSNAPNCCRAVVKWRRRACGTRGRVQWSTVAETAMSHFGTWLGSRRQNLLLSLRAPQTNFQLNDRLNTSAPEVPRDDACDRGT